jgi:hypothetical protein
MRTRSWSQNMDTGVVGFLCGVTLSYLLMNMHIFWDMTKKSDLVEVHNIFPNALESNMLINPITPPTSDVLVKDERRVQPWVRQTAQGEMPQSVKLDIMCRTFNGALFEIMRMLLTFLIFFPMHELSTQIILVFDAENELDHMTASILETAYKNLGVKVYFEEPPPPRTLTGTFRDEGFSRTQWSNFYSDLYSDADFIGMIDSDTEFSFRPSLPDHVILNWQKPIIHGIQVPNRDYSSIEYMIGREGVGEFMYVFPFVVKREHFALMRNHVIKTTGHTTFEQAWYEMQQKFPNWGQFVLMGNYLYHFHHDDYAWDVVYSQISTVPHPCPHLGKNLPMDQNVGLTARKYHHQMCVQSKNIASECANVGMTSNAIEMAKFVPFTDFWPISDSDAAYTNFAASKAHDGAAPRSHEEVFDETVEEVFSHEGSYFWRDTAYNTTERTRRPAA